MLGIKHRLQYFRLANDKLGVDGIDMVRDLI
jgi:hypothetical protein